jgi:hypothetical protein
MNAYAKLARILAATSIALAGSFVNAQTTIGTASVQVIPIVAQTGSYSTEVIVSNATGGPFPIDVLFYEANTSSTPGLKTCAQLTPAGGAAVVFALNTQCTLTPGQNHHGMLVLRSAPLYDYFTFWAYSRSQTPGGNGFSVEGFPIGSFSGAPALVEGLKRQAAAPVYQSNCFVGALDEAVSYQIALFDPTTGIQIGNNVSGTLQPWEMVRYLDIFAVAGAPAGDRSNVRAYFNSQNFPPHALVGFCTVQESTYFGADFRIAKSPDALDNRERRLYGHGLTGNALNAAQSTITDVAQKNIHPMFIAPPDAVRCDIGGPNAAQLEIQVRGPGNMLTAPVFAGGPSPGGDNQTYFFINTGPRSAWSGATDRVYVDVGRRDTSVMPAPIGYGLRCYAGNGFSVPWVATSVADDF